MMLSNIIDLKNFYNLKESGLALLAEFLESFFCCKVRFQQLQIVKFEQHFELDIHTNINRNCYRISKNEMAIVIKVFGETKNSVVAVLPVVLEGENISNIQNSLFENLAIIISKRKE